eukprot:COSAG06_NODE_7951_length_2324_cov_84.087640_1_plen_63_part_00
MDEFTADGLDLLSHGLKPRCRSEYLGQLDWSDLGAGLLPPCALPLAAAEGRDSCTTQHTQAC